METTSLRRTTAKRPAPPAPNRQRLSDKELGKRLRLALISAKAFLLSAAPERRDGASALAYVAGYLEDDAEVAALLSAFARLDFNRNALGDAPPAAPVPSLPA